MTVLRWKRMNGVKTFRGGRWCQDHDAATGLQHPLLLGQRRGRSATLRIRKPETTAEKLAEA
jgi:hypothetical protein